MQEKVGMLLVACCRQTIYGNMAIYILLPGREYLIEPYQNTSRSCTCTECQSQHAMVLHACSGADQGSRASPGRSTSLGHIHNFRAWRCWRAPACARAASRRTSCAFPCASTACLPKSSQGKVRAWNSVSDKCSWLVVLHLHCADAGCTSAGLVTAIAVLLGEARECSCRQKSHAPAGRIQRVQSL